MCFAQITFGKYNGKLFFDFFHNWSTRSTFFAVIIEEFMKEKMHSEYNFGPWEVPQPEKAWKHKLSKSDFGRGTFFFNDLFSLKKSNNLEYAQVLGVMWVKFDSVNDLLSPPPRT